MFCIILQSTDTAAAIMDTGPPYSDILLETMNTLRKDGVLCDAHLQANETKATFPVSIY